MTIASLITGRLVTDPERRTGNSGKPYVKARIAAGTDDSVLVGIVAFGSAAQQLLTYHVKRRCAAMQPATEDHAA